eukprot:1335998-Pyramimonas_sp.AAC.1
MRQSATSSGLPTLGAWARRAETCSPERRDARHSHVSPPSLPAPRSAPPRGPLRRHCSAGPAV